MQQRAAGQSAERRALKLRPDGQKGRATLNLLAVNRYVITVGPQAALAHNLVNLIHGMSLACRAVAAHVHIRCLANVHDTVTFETNSVQLVAVLKTEISSYGLTINIDAHWHEPDHQHRRALA